MKLLIGEKTEMQTKRLLFFMMISFMLVLSACGQGNVEGNDQGQTGDQNQEEAGNNTVDNQDGEDALTIDDYPQFTDTVAENEREAIIHTNMGSIHLKLFPEHAPKAVENFLTHGEEGYYDGVIFHRVIKDFMIQGGDPEGTGRGGQSIYGGPFEDEFSLQLVHLRGALSMANSGANSNGSQFYIVQAGNARFSAEQLAEAGYPEELVEKYAEVGGTPHLDFKHTVFGQVIDGMDVVDAIADVETGAQDRPVEDVIIETVEVVK
ncbi:peptidylprolyl isomerase [Evansella sp. AB-rgal1]|uniref:peptidylprolyl isomerase n=1 Tax=Evansella sp. AB-rgal1 TaxID=3242696 RepID=UPI00359EA83F